MSDNNTDGTDWYCNDDDCQKPATRELKNAVLEGWYPYCNDCEPVSPYVDIRSLNAATEQ